MSDAHKGYTGEALDVLREFGVAVWDDVEIESARSLEHVRSELAAGNLSSLLLSPDAGLEHIPMVHIPDADRAAIARGQIIRVRGTISGPVDPAVVLEQADVVRVLDARGSLAAMAHVTKGRLYPDKVFVTPEDLAQA